jgi:hypothetical protein
MEKHKSYLYFPFYRVIMGMINYLWRLHWKDKIPKFWNKYSQKRNIGVSVPVSTYVRLWAIYIFPPSVCLICWRKYVERSWDYINLSQTHECGNRGWGRAIPRKGIHKWDFCCSVAFVQIPIWVLRVLNVILQSTVKLDESSSFWLESYM